MKTIGEITDFEPQIVAKKYGTEPSLNEIMYFFYREQGLSEKEAEATIKKYIKALEEYVK